MVDPLFLSHLLVIVAALILVAELYTVVWIRRLRRELDGEDGSQLLTVMSRFAIGVAVAQALTFVNAWVRLSDPVGSGDIRLTLFLLIQILFAGMLFWVVWEVRRMPVR